MTVLILSEDLDPAVDAVVDLLKTRDVPVFRCDLSWFPQRMTFEAQFVDGRWDGVLSTAQRQVPLGELRSVWYRHPTPFRFPDGMSGPERRHSTHEAKIGLGGVLWSLPVLWVNHPARQADCYKPAQLAVAARCGLAVPATQITNRPDAVGQFARTRPGGLVLKQLGFVSINEAGGQRALFTRLLTEEDLSNLVGVEHSAHTFQAWIDKQFDARVTAVGEQLFAAALYAGSAAGRVDFRADYDSLTYQEVTPPAAVAAGVSAFMSHFGLAFGAFDFVVDRAGRWWFLECNPGGQYGFVEHGTGMPISRSIADLLQRGPT